MNQNLIFSINLIWNDSKLADSVYFFIQRFSKNDLFLYICWLLHEGIFKKIHKVIVTHLV